MMKGAWQPNASLERLRQRADLLVGIRRYFQEAGVLEVETPVISHAGNTDPSIESLLTTVQGAEGISQTGFLHTSPEFPMKRLLAAGYGSIYQVSKVFRDGEFGRHHNPEFTLLEWYREGYDHLQLMTDVENLVNSLLPVPARVRRVSYAVLFQETLGIDPDASTISDLKSCALKCGVPISEGFELPDKDAWLNLLLTHLIEPEMDPEQLTFLFDYPASQAALARIRPGSPALAERFELYYRGMELANGFHELSDAGEQRKRFQKEQKRRGLEGRMDIPMDQHLLAALESGLPDCAGVALGVDRLLMAIIGVKDIREVLTFAFDRA